MASTSIGLLGGSFDPVHRAHLAMADGFAVALGLDEVRFVPASQPWQKHGLLASGADRAAMLAAALAEHRPARGRFTIDTRELEREGKTYTIETLAAVRDEEGPDVALTFLIGADQLLHLDTWKEWHRLWDYAHVAAATRPGFDASHLPAPVAAEWNARLGDADALRHSPSGRTFILDDLALPVSATDIRHAFATGDATRDAMDDVVPDAVLDYIRAHNLYRS